MAFRRLQDPRVAFDLLVANGFLQLLDVLTSFLVLSLGGIEGNPASAQMMARWGFGAWIFVKLLIALAITGFALPLWDAAPKAVRFANLALLPFTLVMVAIVVNNAAIVVRHA